MHISVKFRLIWLDWKLCRPLGHTDTWLKTMSLNLEFSNSSHAVPFEQVWFPIGIDSVHPPRTLISVSHTSCSSRTAEQPCVMACPYKAATRVLCNPFHTPTHYYYCYLTSMRLASVVRAGKSKWNVDLIKNTWTRMYRIKGVVWQGEILPMKKTSETSNIYFKNTMGGS